MADKRDVRSALRAYEQPSMLQGAWDEISGAFARYGRRSGAQRDASLAMLNQAVDPNTDPLTGAGMKALGLAGLVTHPLAFFPTGDEWRERLRASGNDGRMGQAIGGMLGDLPSIVDPHLLAGGGALAMAPLASKLMNKADDAGIIAYHGSPHSFDKFDMSKIGTGEGAQAYGHGLYFAENEGVAKNYRDMLSDQPQALPAIDWRQRMDWTEAQDEAYTLADKALEELQIDIMQGGSSRPDWGRLTDKVRQLAPRGKEDGIAGALDDLANKYGWKEFVNKNPGSMYQVKINVKPDELLDLDAPLSDQPEAVRKAVQSAVSARYNGGTPEKKGVVKRNFDAIQNGTFDGVDGSVALKQAGDIVSQPEAAARLRAAGIKGLRYKDAGSRGGQGGTYNYVVFDDSLITILKKYGIPMTAGAGGAMMVAGQDMPPDIASQMGGT